MDGLAHRRDSEDTESAQRITFLLCVMVWRLRGEQLSAHWLFPALVPPEYGIVHAVAMLSL
jgi:hypothetical protein